MTATAAGVHIWTTSAGIPAAEIATMDFMV